MALINWAPGLAVGIKVIDDQHKTLVDMVNRLNEAMTVGKGKSVIGEILAELIQYTQTHFATEEKLMSQHAYSHSPSHQAEHRKLVAEVKEFKRKFDSGNATLSVNVLNFLCEWLKTHIQDSDKKLGSDLAAKGVS